jgi:hypothetical protein
MLKILLIVSLISIPSLSYGQQAPESNPFNLAVPLLQSQPSPFSGLLLPETTSANIIRLLAERLQLRTNLAVERERTASLQAEYTSALTTCRNDVVLARSRTWWERNGVWVALTTGFVAGTVLTILVAQAVSN